MLRSALCILILASAFIAGAANEMPRLVFPVSGGVKSWKPNFGVPRDGGRRQHKGQDLMAPRMTPVVACFPGTVYMSKGANAGNWLTLVGTNGWIANYMHLNDDRTDRDDDAGTKELAFAPWLENGGRVQAGDLLGFVGNSGNAKTSGHHLHFELIDPSGYAVDPAPALRAAAIHPAPRLDAAPPTYEPPVYIEKIVERPEPMELAPLPTVKDQAILRFGAAGTPPPNTEFVLRIDDRDRAVSGKTTLTYTWDTLREADGEHAVQFLRRNIVDRSEAVLESRTVVVENSAVPVRPRISGDRLEVLMGINYYRRLSGLPYVTWDERLGVAAGSHSSYWESNKGSVRHSAHNEERGRSGFTGEMPSDRAKAQGYFGGVSECMHFVGAKRAADLLWAVPYHRLALSHYGAENVGVGASGSTVTVNLGIGEREGVVVFPPDGMTGVPLQGSIAESPAPLRMHRGPGGPVGYVVTYGLNAPALQRIRVVRAELREAGRIVDCYVNTPANDETLETGVILIPKSPLRPQTTYEAYVEASDSRGKDISRRWRFTTGREAHESATMDYRAAVAKAVHAQPGERKIRGKVRLVAEDGEAFSIDVLAGDGAPADAVGTSMWVGLGRGVPVRLGDDPLGIYPFRPDLTPGETVVIIGAGGVPTGFVPRIVIVK